MKGLIKYIPKKRDKWTKNYTTKNCLREKKIVYNSKKIHTVYMRRSSFKNYRNKLSNYEN